MRTRKKTSDTKQIRVLQYNALFDEQPDGGYTVTVPLLPGCITEGDTFEEAKKNVAEAIELYLEDLAADGEDIPVENSASFFEKIAISTFPSLSKAI